MLAAAWPSADQISRVNAATDVLPLVPVTAAITCGWREKNFAAVSAKARRASSTLMNATPSGSGVAGGRSAITAAAPDATACETKLSPSSCAPATGQERAAGVEGAAAGAAAGKVERGEARLADGIHGERVGKLHGVSGPSPLAGAYRPGMRTICSLLTSSPLTPAASANPGPLA